MNERDSIVACLRCALASADSVQAKVIKEAIDLIESGAYIKQYDGELYIFECNGGPWAIKDNVCSCLSWERHKACPHILIINILKEEI